MKKTLLLSVVLMALVLNMNAQEYKVVTIIESIVTMGLGRSRIIEHSQSVNYQDFTTTRTGGQDSKQGDVKRSDAKIDALEETKLLNFFSGVGINFQNIASNDALISSKINTMVKTGWKLEFVTSAVESDAGKDDNNGIFITRLVFKK
jgi:hypothetical protein